jgi:hypothetical protein
MRKHLLTALLLALSFSGFSQVRFESGYFINNSNERVNCLIRNADWSNNPTKFQYKTTNEEKVQKADISSVKEFGIGTSLKYKRFDVQIDKTPVDIDKLGMEKDPVYKNETLFLKVETEGKVTLLSYTSGTLIRYFVETDAGVQQLVYKQYLVTYGQVGYNESYKQQLTLLLNCGTVPNTADLKYELNELVKLVADHNTCTGSGSYTYKAVKNKKSQFHIAIRPGVRSGSYSLTGNLYGPNFPNSTTINFKNQTTFRLGVEAEFTLPFHKNKWNIFLEPTYQSYKSEATFDGKQVPITYNSIELPIGVRYYAFFSDDASLFLNLAYAFDFASSTSGIDFEPPNGDLKIKSSGNLNLGGGLKYKKRYSAELRWGAPRGLLEDYPYFRSKDFKSVSLIFGYNLF